VRAGARRRVQWRYSIGQRSRLVGGFAICSAIVALASVVGAALAVAAVVVAASVNVPQMWQVLRGAGRSSGVSATTYWLFAAARCCSLVYGILVGDLVISAPHLLLLPTALATAVVTSRWDPTLAGSWLQQDGDQVGTLGACSRIVSARQS
jgi:uncharacterized protein with PQ loop repeat